MTCDLMKTLGPVPPAYEKLRGQLQGLGWLCQGTAVSRALRRKVRGKWVNKGPYYMWTGKSAGKTICHALSKEQYQAARKAIEANRAAMNILEEMQAMTLKEILENQPGVIKRK